METTSNKLILFIWHINFYMIYINYQIKKGHLIKCKGDFMKNPVIVGKKSFKSKDGREFYVVIVGKMIGDYENKFAPSPDGFGIAETNNLFVCKDVYDKIKDINILDECIIDYNVGFNGKAYVRNITLIGSDNPNV